MKITKLITRAVTANALLDSNLCRNWGVSLSVVLVASLTACAPGTLINISGPQAGTALSGTVHSGPHAIRNSLIQLYAAGVSGDGSLAIALLANPVHSDSSGSFSLSEKYTCPSASSQIYLVAKGGVPGAGFSQNNSAIALMATLGSCGDLTAANRIDMNEISTAASVWLLAPFMQASTAVGSGNGSTNALVAAFDSADALAKANSGVSVGSALPGGNSPISTLADTLAQCVNSGGGVAGDGSSCGELFSLTTGQSGVSPTDTIAAALAIAKDPDAQKRVTLALGTNPFSGGLTEALTANVANNVGTLNKASTALTNLPMESRMADSFVESVGLNVHFSYYGSVYTSQATQMLKNISKLGVRHLRDQMAWEGPTPGSPFYTMHNALGSLGVKTDYILTSIDYPMSYVKAYPTLVNDMEAVEPTNEYDASGDADWVRNIQAQQSALYTQVRGDTAMSGISVLSPSLAQPQNAEQLLDVSDISDLGNSHAYFGGWNPGNSGTDGANNPDYFEALALINTPVHPIWVTETGFWSAPGPYYGGLGVSEAAMAAYTPRAILEFWRAGTSRTYQYELADFAADVHFGLLRTDGTPKPAFVAVANLLNLLKDPGGPFQPAALDCSLGGDSHLHHVLLQKRDGSFYLALWNEALSYDFKRSQPLAVPSQKVTLQISRPVVSASAYQWQPSGAMTLSSMPARQSMTLKVTDKLQIIKLILQ